MTATTIGARADEAVLRVGNLHAVAVARVLFGFIVIRHFWPDLRSDTLPVERFHVVWWSWLPEPSPVTYRVLLWVAVAAGIAMILGVAARAAGVVALAVVAYLLFVDMVGFAHNRAFLVVVLAGLALMSTGPSAGLLSRTKAQAARTEEQGVLWPLYLLRVMVSSVYLTSALTKLANPDWRDGLILWDRVVRLEHRIPFDGWIHDALTSRWFYALLSPSAIAAELFIGIGLWFRRTRLAAIWVAIAFHGSIEVTASVQTFSYSAIAALLIWVTPSTRDRTIVAAPRRFRRLVERLDWLRRFDVETADMSDRSEVVMIDRDNRVRRGLDAQLTILSRLPVLFFFVAPLLACVRIWSRIRVDGARV